jgi:hypothetical protein
MRLVSLERDAELKTVDALIRRSGGGGRLLAIESPPGIGKTSRTAFSARSARARPAGQAPACELQTARRARRRNASPRPRPGRRGQGSRSGRRIPPLRVGGAGSHTNPSGGVTSTSAAPSQQWGSGTRWALPISSALAV